MRKIGLWMYKNGGGEKVQSKIVEKLKEKNIQTICDLNLKDAYANENGIFIDDLKLNELDLFFSYNASGQTAQQIYMYEELNKYIPMINSFKSFKLSEDKFRTNMALNKAGIKTAQFLMCDKNNTKLIKNTFKKWHDIFVYKPTSSWGGRGLSLIDSKNALDAILPLLENINTKNIYIEKYIPYDKTDYRVDIVNNKYVSIYGRKAPKDSWKTNITCGGSIILREDNLELINIAKKATKILGLDIAGVDIIYDEIKKEYIVLEVNGIPAFATQDQENIGLKFNDKKIDLIVDLIDKKTKIIKNSITKDLMWA